MPALVLFWEKIQFMRYYNSSNEDDYLESDNNGSFVGGIVV